MHALKTIGIIALLVLTADFLGFTAWIMSGQHPVDGFYLGAITTNIIKGLLVLF